MTVVGVICALPYIYEAIPRHALPQLPAHPIDGPRRATKGPLRVHSTNPRYFMDANGEALLLTGSHTWANFADNGFGDPPPPFDYEGYLDFLVAHNHNFMRLWSWEQSRWASWVTENDYYFYPGPPYQRTGPGKAADDKPRFNLDAFNPAYFERLRARVQLAGQRGIYVSIMLFNGWSVDRRHGKLLLGNPWHGHPFNRHNNVNGVDGDLDNDDGGEETHELVIPRITAYQEAYMRRVIDTVNDLDNVLFEISNESWAGSKQWQYHMIRVIHEYEASKPRQHPVGMTQYEHPGNNADLFAGPEEWISPWQELPQYPYKEDPPVADGRKVVIVDTDHLWGIGGDRKWAWKTFMRGAQPSFMDAYDGSAVGVGAPRSWDDRQPSWKRFIKGLLQIPTQPGWDPNGSTWVSLRQNMGHILRYASRVDLATMQPRPTLSSSGFCLARVDASEAEYLIYIEDSHQPLAIDLSGYAGLLAQEWFDPVTMRTVTAAAVHGGAMRQLRSPFQEDAVLYLRSQAGTAAVPDQE